MEGYLRILKSDFADWDANYKQIYIEQTGDTTVASYTFIIPDIDPDYAWARVEHDFVAGDIKTYEEAIANGMIIDNVAE